MGWVHYYSDQAACNADGGNCSDPDNDTAGGAAVCEGPLPGCWASNHSHKFSGSLWNFENLGLQSPECCGDDPNEFLITFKNATGMKPIPGSGNWKACCDNSTDCVIDGSYVGDPPGVKCYDSFGPESCQHDIDGDNFVDYCNNGVWMPCEVNYTIRITGPYGVADELYGTPLPPERFLPS
ncbi:MAG TPA: hypothetical protein ENF95_00780 [Candidatus Aenigmarchaeota archaeon]|nr:hypothetical protein [Candidatus Aenigmarchaeota archaeon]